nr:hypothetical protein CFP56_54362 [Quercus suber]
MRPSRQSQPNQDSLHDARPWPVQNNLSYIDAQTGSGLHFDGGMANNAWEQNGQPSCITQPNTFIPTLRPDESQTDCFSLVGPSGDSEHEAYAIRTAKNLLGRFKASVQYMKYRTRQQKDSKQAHEQKWPDHLEEAFFRGKKDMFERESPESNATNFRAKHS